MYKTFTFIYYLLTSRIAANQSNKWDVMISYEWSTGLEYADKLCEVLKQNNYTVWLDRSEMKGNMYKEMANAVANSEVIILLISEKYEISANCSKEYAYANDLKKKIIPTKVENYRPPNDSALAFSINFSTVYIKISTVK